MSPRRPRRSRLRHLVAVVLIVAYGLPLLWVVLTSLKSETELGTSAASFIFQPTLSAYDGLGSMVTQPIVQSIVISLSTTVVVVVLGLLLGYGLTHVRGRFTRLTVGAVMALLILIQMVPQPTSVIPLYGVLARWHLINSTAGVVVADAALLLPLSAILLRPFFLNVPRELEEAAAVDGAGMVSVMMRVVIPLVVNGLVTVALIVFMITWGEFIYAVTFLNSAQLFPVSAVLVDQVGQLTASWNVLMALAVITSLPLVVAFVLGQRRLREGLTVGAIR